MVSATSSSSTLKELLGDKEHEKNGGQEEIEPTPPESKWRERGREGGRERGREGEREGERESARKLCIALKLNLN